MDFKDEFTQVQGAKPHPPAQYVRLSEAQLTKRDLETFPEEIKQNALKRYELLNFIERKNTGGWTQKNLDPLLDSFFATNVGERPNWRTVARWYKSYMDSNGDLASLVEKNHKKGNRNKRVDGDEHFFEVALLRFLDAKRPNITKAYQYYKDTITIENDSIVDGKIPIISYNSFKNRIKSLPPYHVAVARHGKFMADKWFDYCASHKPPTRILERVEIDHTPLDLILLDDALLIPLGRPYLTLVVDVFSGCVLGFHLGYNSPSYVSAAKAIVHAIKPKTLDMVGIELQNGWPCWGKFETLVVDNGAEFWSHSLDHACKEAGINIQYNPVRKPWLKPFVERFFGMINQSFLAEIPGKTFSNILEKEDYKPEKDAIMRFSVFVEEFHRWIVDVYHQDTNSRETRIPIQRWQQGFDVYPPLRMTAEDERRFEALMGLSERRTLTRNGIKYSDLMYDSAALADYRKQYPQSKESIKKLIKIDPDDLSSIHVYLEELEGYLRVPCTDATGYTQGLSLHAHTVIKKVNREIIRESKDNLGLAQARMAINERIQQEQELVAASKTKLTATKKQAQFAGISNTGQRSISPTLPSKSQPKESNSQHNIKDILEGWGEDLEAFE
ncbi:Mu transposase C-terminal domain-containing protein [Shewanella sp. FJAT-52076]|uniref:Mu transposase C-terminal domain-containing protein n=1 Tax=Shewanella sp. FJAT-52076 TaxID=2864202 RepID=UPI0021ABD43D|nr:Mu transposase C-terminal domain-containing protein [Shewanella sp. FJAT-52076]